MSLLSIVASSSAFRLPASPPPKGSSIDSDWSTKNKKQPGFLRLISAWYAMVFLLSRPSPECSNARPFCEIRRDELYTARSLLHSTHRGNAWLSRSPHNGFTSRRSGIALGRQRAGLRLPNDCNRLAVWFSGKKNDGGFGEGRRQRRLRARAVRRQPATHTRARDHSIGYLPLMHEDRSARSQRHCLPIGRGLVDLCLTTWRRRRVGGLLRHPRS